jgi:hypothetical protein
MGRRWKIVALAAAALIQAAVAAQPSLQSGSVIDAAQHLKAGEFLWAPQVAPEGPVLLVVSLATQRATIYRNGIPIGITTVSTGRPGHVTPTGIFTVLQRQVEHFSSLYNSAPMPYMQRITWGGVALHGGNLPGYPASHGCIRLPHEFARLLYGVTRLGMTVVITDQATVPRVAPAETLLRGAPPSTISEGSTSWRPERSPLGPISIIVSAGDRRLLVLRNGIVIGTAPVAIDGAIARTYAFVLASGAGPARSWTRIALPGQESDSGPTQELRGRIHVAEPFRRSLEAVLQPGTTVVVTQDSLRGGGSGRAMTVVEGDLADRR